MLIFCYKRFHSPVDKIGDEKILDSEAIYTLNKENFQVPILGWKLFINGTWLRLLSEISIFLQFEVRAKFWNKWCVKIHLNLTTCHEHLGRFTGGWLVLVKDIFLKVFSTLIYGWTQCTHGSSMRVLFINNICYGVAQTIKSVAM